MSFTIRRRESAVWHSHAYIAYDQAGVPRAVFTDLLRLRDWCLAQHPTGAIDYDLNPETRQVEVTALPSGESRQMNVTMR